MPRTPEQSAEDKARAEKERLGRTRNFDCPLTESRCTESGCSLTRCVGHEREEVASRHYQEERTTRTSRHDTRKSRRGKRNEKMPVPRPTKAFIELLFSKL